MPRVFGTPTCVNYACSLCGGFMQPAGCVPVDCTFNAAACDGGSDNGIVDGGQPDDGDSGAPTSRDAGFAPTLRTGLGNIGCGPNVCNANTEFCYSSCGGDPLNSLSCLAIPTSFRLNAADLLRLLHRPREPRRRPTGRRASLCTILAVLTDAGNCNEFLRYCSQ